MKRRESAKRRKISPLTGKLLEDQREAFRQKFGREPGPKDFLCFDSDSPTPREADSREVFDELVAAGLDAGIDPVLLYAVRKTGRETEGLQSSWRGSDNPDITRDVCRHAFIPVGWNRTTKRGVFLSVAGWGVHGDKEAGVVAVAGPDFVGTRKMTKELALRSDESLTPVIFA